MSYISDKNAPGGFMCPIWTLLLDSKPSLRGNLRQFCVDFGGFYTFLHHVYFNIFAIRAGYSLKFRWGGFSNREAVRWGKGGAGRAKRAKNFFPPHLKNPCPMGRRFVRWGGKKFSARFARPALSNCFAVRKSAPSKF